MTQPLELREWAGAQQVQDKPWLLLGKGPSFSKITQIDPAQYRVCTLNHVIREIPADIAHIIDLDVVCDCADAIERNARALVMPYHPHVNNRPSDKSLTDFASEIPVLRKLAAERRLVWYNAATSKKRHGDSPVIDVKFFSAEAALNLLATIGVRTVRSLGIDGGARYSSAFDDLNDTTRLANGQDSFDKQFAGIAKTIRTTGIFYAPLHIPAPVRVFVGSDAAQIAGVKVLEYSIKKFASMSVEIVVIDDRDIPVPKEPSNRSRTGFSFSRFGIPELCGYRGRAIYVDADMQVFTDIAKLWNQDMGDAWVLYAESVKGSARVPQFSVMLMDCGSLDWNVRRIVEGLDNRDFDYRQLMQQLCIMPVERREPRLPFEWNSLEHYEAGRTNLIHYTDMPTQPWVSHGNKHGKLWYDCCREAVDEGFISKDFLYGEVHKGNVSPELPAWLGLPNPPEFDRIVAEWTPPYRRFAAMAKVPQLGAAGEPAHARPRAAAPAGSELAADSRGVAPPMSPLREVAAAARQKLERLLRF
jgi:hypothetical protein